MTIKIEASKTYVFQKSGNLVRTIALSDYLGEPTWEVERVDGESLGKRMTVTARSLSIPGGWLWESVQHPKRGDGPMANENKVQVEVLTPSGAVERRNFFVASEPGGFDDRDERPIQAWRPIPADSQVIVHKWHGPTIGWKVFEHEPWKPAA